MKSFIVIVTIAFFAGAFALTEEQKAKGLQYAQQCGEKHGVVAEDYMKLRGGDFANHNSEKEQCFVQCFLELAGILKGDVVQEDVILEKLSQDVDKDKVQTIINACKNEKGANDCETAYKLFQCYYNNKAALQ